MTDDEALLIIDLFSSHKGQSVLKILEARANSLVRIDQRPTPAIAPIAASGNSMGNPGHAGNPNEAFLNPNAALYRAGMTDQLSYIRRLIEKKEQKYGYQTITLDEIRAKESDRNVQRSLDGEEL